MPVAFPRPFTDRIFISDQHATYFEDLQMVVNAARYSLAAFEKVPTAAKQGKLLLRPLIGGHIFEQIGENRIKASYAFQLDMGGYIPIAATTFLGLRRTSPLAHQRPESHNRSPRRHSPHAANVD